MVVDDRFINIRIEKYNEIIGQLKDYEKSLIKIDYYSNFEERSIEYIKEELNQILTKY